MPNIQSLPLTIHSPGIRFKTTRAHGPGGQRINHRSTKVQLWVRVCDLPIDETQKKRLRKKLSPHHLNHRDEIWVECEEERSQELNRHKAIEHLNNLIADALYVKPKRIPTEPPRKAKDARIHEKKIISEKKQSRRFRN